jgi:hypothetical protein
MLPVYTITIFLSAALLFLVQPMIAKMVLPMLGGSPSVWITAMVFFQAILLAGYAYAHALCRWMGPRSAAIAHGVVVVLPIALLPIALPAWTTTGAAGESAGQAGTMGSQSLWLLLVLLVAVGGPFFVLSSTGPILQRWFSQTDHVHAKDPYFLYAASNVGSLLALLAYPVLLEPMSRLSEQRLGWSIGYGAFAIAMWVCAAVLIKRKTHGAEPGEKPSKKPSEKTNANTERADEQPEPIALRQRLFWVLLAFVPSSLMLGVTNTITTDIASVPLLWIVPLALYLLTFVLAFARRQFVPMASLSRLLPILAVALVVVVLRQARTPAGPILGLHLAFFFFAALVCHTRLAGLRPSAARLTEFFLFVSIGGVLGGVFNALVAPFVFNTVAEYPIVIVLACLLRPAIRGKESSGEPVSSRKASGLSATRRGRILDLALPVALLVAMLAMEFILNPGQSGRSAGANAAILIATVGLPALAVFLLSSVPLRFAGAVAASLIVAQVTSDLGGERLHIRRTFFGVYRVSRDPIPRPIPTITGLASPLGDVLITFSHGTTQHGQQSPAMPHLPLGYYHPDGPIGHVFTALNASAVNTRDKNNVAPSEPDRPGPVALIGLGAGALAAYGQQDQPFDVYEIDQAVVDIARNTDWFTYLSDSKAALSYTIGDGRIKIASAPDNHYSLIVLDAFSSDAIPVHLLTKEAFAVYLSKLQPDGLIAVHITNRHLDLKPVVAAAARDLGLAGLDWFDVPADPALTQRLTGRTISHWIVLARTSDTLMPIYRPSGGRDGGGRTAGGATGGMAGSITSSMAGSIAGWEPLTVEPNARAWTDDFSNIIGALRWD